jgi:hypothetical protein
MTIGPPHHERGSPGPAEGGPVPPSRPRTLGCTTHNSVSHAGRPALPARPCAPQRWVPLAARGNALLAVWLLQGLPRVQRAEACYCMQGDLLTAARDGDAGKVQRCLAAGVSVNCKNMVGAPLLPMPVHIVELPAFHFVRWG